MSGFEIGKKLAIFYDQFVEKNGYVLVLEGLGTTILLSICAFIIGVIIGTLVAIFLHKRDKNRLEKLLAWLLKIYVGFFRGTPIIVQLLFMYFVFLPLLGLGGLSALLVAVAIFGLNSGAYVSEIVRGGILSVDRRQDEAARALGLKSRDSMRFVVFPQALKNAIPNLCNEFITLLKETSVANYIAVHDLTYAFSAIANASYETMIPYFCLAVCYLVMVIGASSLIKIYEKRLRKSDKH